VDREERPDIDDVYMTACQLSGGRSCGWPLNVFAMPDGRPVWAGTYFPKKDWMNILNTFADKQKTSPQELEQYASQLTQGIQTSELIPKREGAFDFTPEKLDGIYEKYISTIDFKEGGRKGAPKFPMPNNYDFLLRYYYKTKNTRAFEAVDLTLTKLAMGGIYDQIGGGFARYSTDGMWKVPHFEKMLYDNGQLISLYAQAYSFTKNPMYKDVIEQSLTFVERELLDKSGGFYSSLDADSDGEEGKYYVWTKNEIDSILGDEQLAKIFDDYYEVKKRGNWEKGQNILYRRTGDKDFAGKFDLTEAALKTKLKKASDKLLAARENRVHPGLDDKILTAWNALMLKGYVDAYKALDNEKYREMALTNAKFITTKAMDKDFRLNRNFKDGKSSINAFLDDYALTIQAFTALYEITFDEQWLKTADGLAAYAIQHFYDKENGFFNYTSDVDPALIARKQELSDNVIPGSNSSMARALFTLGTYLYKPDYIQMAGQMLHSVEPNIVENENPTFF
ncbi:MAG TPA: thioredoxin domain-containing protein, partial [Saprospiraceae bacterium]|nr:thioredoxin domain-containing protein [Saprospiraceae bacterium]